MLVNGEILRFFPSHLESFAKGISLQKSILSRRHQDGLFSRIRYAQHALGSYLALQNARRSITGKAREVVNLVVSQVDLIVIVGDKTITNYLHSVTKVPVDFPAAPELAA